jgi:two-component system alkaline phosphatase synthesis response regulator PhoP
MLTPREWEVLQLSATGIPIKQIAEKLSISERTVEKHRSNIIQKTNSENIMEVVFMYGKNVMYQ